MPDVIGSVLDIVVGNLLLECKESDSETKNCMPLKIDFPFVIFWDVRKMKRIKCVFNYNCINNECFGVNSNSI